MSERELKTRTSDANASVGPTAPAVEGPLRVPPASVTPLAELKISPLEDRSQLDQQFEALQARLERSGLSEALSEFVEQQYAILECNVSQCFEQEAAVRGGVFAPLFNEGGASLSEQRNAVEIAAIRIGEEIRQARNGLRTGTLLPLRDPVLYSALDENETLFTMRTEFTLQQLGLPTSWASGAAESLTDLILAQRRGEVALGVEPRAELIVALRLFQVELNRLNECARSENRPEFSIPELNACAEKIRDADKNLVESGRELVESIAGKSDKWLVERLQAGIKTEPIFAEGPSSIFQLLRPTDPSYLASFQALPASQATRPMDRQQLDELISLHDRVLLGVLPRALPMSDGLAGSLILPQEFLDRRPAPSVAGVQEQSNLGLFSLHPRIPPEQRLELAVTLPARQREQELVAIAREIYRGIGDASMRVDLAEFSENTTVHRTAELLDRFTNPFAGLADINCSGPTTIAGRADRWKRSMSDFNLRYVGDLTEQATTAIIYDRHAEGVGKLVEALRRTNAVTDIASRYEAATVQTELRTVSTAVNALMLGFSGVEVALAGRLARIELQGAKMAREGVRVAQSPASRIMSSVASLRSSGMTSGVRSNGALLSASQRREQLLAQYPGLRARLAPELPSTSVVRPTGPQPGALPTGSSRRLDFGDGFSLHRARPPSGPPSSGTGSVVGTQRSAPHISSGSSLTPSANAPSAATLRTGTTSNLRRSQATVAREGSVGAESLESTTVSVLERVPQPRSESLTSGYRGSRGSGFERSGRSTTTQDPMRPSGPETPLREFDLTARPASFSPRPAGFDYTTRADPILAPTREGATVLQPQQFPELPLFGALSNNVVREVVSEPSRIIREDFREEIERFVERPADHLIEPRRAPDWEIEVPSGIDPGNHADENLIVPLRREIPLAEAARTSLPLQRQSEIIDRALAGDLFLAEDDRAELKQAVAELLGRSASMYEIEREMHELGLGADTIRELLSVPVEKPESPSRQFEQWRLSALVASAEGLQPQLTPRQAEVKVELDQMLERIQALEADPATASEALEFSERVYEGYFSSSDTPIGALPIGEALKFVAQATRSPTVRATWGTNAVLALVYEMSFSKCVDRVVTSIEASEVSEQLDILHQLQTVAANAVANGSWAQPAVRQIGEIVGRVEAQTQVPLVGYLCQSIAGRILAERQNPSLGVLKLVGNPSDSRVVQPLAEGLATLSKLLGRQLVRSDGQAISGRLLPIASDSVVLLDHSGLPHSFGSVDFSQLPSPAKIEPSELAVVRRRLEGDVPIDRLLGAVLDARFYLAVEAGVEEASPIANRNLIRELPSLSEVEATSVIEAIESLDRVLTETRLAERRAVQEAGDACEQHSSAWIEASRAQLARYVEQHPEYAEYRATLEQRLADLEQHGLLDEQFDLIEQIGYQQIPELSAAIRASLSELRKLHSATSANSQVVLENSPERANWQRDSEAAERQILALTPKFELLRDDLQQLFERLEHSNNSSLLPVALRPFAEIGTDPILNPFLHNHPDQVALLLKHLGSQELRNRIEQDLRVPLSGIPIRAQIHFLRYLEQQDTQGFAQLRTVLQEHPTLSNKILRAFIANAENPKFCKAIFQVAKLEEPLADAILSKYLELAEVGEHEIVRAVTQLDPSHPVQVERRALVEVMRRANRLLEQFGTSGATLDPDTLLARLDDTRKEVVVLAMSFKTVARSTEVVLGEIAGMDLTCARPTELSPELVAQMRRIYADNCYKDYSREHADKIMEYFEKSLQNPEARFYTLEFEGKLLAFVRAVPQEDGSVHIGAFNSCSDAMNSQIAPALFRHMLSIEGPQAELVGEVYKKKVGFLMPTYEAVGWRRGEDILNWEGTGADLLEIRRPLGPLAPRGASPASSSSGVE